MAKKKTSVGCLFWVALLALVLVVFLFTWPQVSKVLKDTGFFTTLFKPADKKPTVVNKETGTLGTESNNTGSAQDDNKKPSVLDVSDSVKEEQPKTNPTSSTNKQETKPTAQTKSSEVISKPEEEKKSRNSVLYFVSINDSSNIQMKQIIRKVTYTDSPLTETVQALLKGLTSKEISDGNLSLIPENTKLLGVSIKGDTAYINFNEAFRYNQVGKDGFVPQLKQIVYTVTEFSNIKQVQIQIEGNISTYLGAEGVKIDKPLTRSILDHL